MSKGYRKPNSLGTTEANLRCVIQEDLIDERVG